MYELEQFLSSSRIGAYRDFNNSIDYYIKLSKNTRKTENIESSLSEAIALFDLLEKRRDEIQNMYMQIPDSISINTVNLARDLTRNKINTFEKVKAIENYLSRNFHYTLSPQIPPADKDFVEHFLFDGKEGYCSYYASAMCILVRISGIPARYVEGFVLPGESTEDGYYYVTNNNAHAWVEVYFEGIGWVTFEPTSPMEGAMDYFVSLSDSSDNTSLEDDDQFNDFDDLNELDDEQMGNNGDQDFAAGIGRNNNISFGIFALALMTAIILLWIVNMIYILIRKVVLRLFLKKKTAVLLYNYSISLLKQAGRHVRSGETPLDFAARIDELYKFSDMNMKSFVEVYYSVRFGLKTLDKKTIRRLFDFVGELKKESGSNMYIVKRILYRGLLFNG